MDAKQQCCDNYECPDKGETNRGNIKVLSYKEQRYYCMTCGQTFSASRGTTFYRLRTDRQDFVEAVGMLAERCSLRGIARVKRVKPDTALRWLDIAGAQAAAVSGALIQNLHLTQVQIDELWTFVKKSHGTSRRMKSFQEWVITGYGPLSRYRVGCALPVTSAKSGAKRPRPDLSSKYGPRVMGERPSLRATSCPHMLRRWSPITAPSKRPQRNAGEVARANNQSA